MQAFANLFGQNKNKLVITTAVPVDDQFMSTKSINWIPSLSKLLVSNYNLVSAGGKIFVRNSGLSHFSKIGIAYVSAIDADSLYLYALTTSAATLKKIDLLGNIIASSGTINSERNLDASGDPDYVYVTSNNAADGHGVRKVRKSDMTVVASILATGAGDGQFNNPLGIKYYSGFVYVADYQNKRIVILNASDLSFSSKVDLGFWPNDLDTDGVVWYIAEYDGVIGRVYKKNFDFSALTPDTYISGIANYSLCIIPDQGDGYGATLAIVDFANSHLERRKCSDLSAINSVGSAGDGSSSLCDPVVTGPAGFWIDSEGSRYAVASAANISKNSFSGDFFRQTPNRMTYQPTGTLAAITAIDANADAIVGEIKNLYKCINLTSLKLQTNPALVLDLGRLTAKLQTLWAYACGAGVSGSIRHMTALAAVNLRENGATSAQVDGWIDDIWQNRDILGILQVNFNGTNAAPSGIYQDATPPTTGLEKVFDLVENYGWSVATS